ncbi:hypothetical protein PROFUN_01663 [Planoprotostelium fungivorum]|uniref:Amidohydrolase-related domain-containing protein n=1 Tax=Planoprotostelium fungivorum TaxID=1890364 RepID=A0A2P6MW68_9EUKA|nr:hypothetical protein PROFUN_01663 [Planoprotostelium fungivorum]
MMNIHLRNLSGAEFSINAQPSDTKQEESSTMAQRVDTIIHARWIVPVEPRDVYHEHHSLVIRDGVIVDILPTKDISSKYVADKEHDLSKHHALMPGLVNLHSHSPMTLLRGLCDGVELNEWLIHFMWPHEGKWMSPEFVRTGSRIAVSEMIKSGVTCFNDMYFFPDVTAEVVDQVGMRGTVGAIIIQFPSAWASSSQEYIDKGLALIQKYEKHSRIRVVLAPHATYTVGDEDLLRMKEISERYDTKVHIHLHETSFEVSEHKKNDQLGRSPIKRLVDLGMMNERLIAVHMTQLTDEDINIVASSGASVAHCPESNLKLGSGICPTSKLIRAGVNVGLGTDGAASNDDLDMLGEMRTSALVDKYKVEDPALPGAEILRFGTMNGAKALGLDHLIGSLEVGKRADVIAVKLAARPVYNPIISLVYVGTNRVEYSWVDGRCILDEGKLTIVDESTWEKEIDEWGEKIISWDRERKSPDLKQINTQIQTYLSSQLKEEEKKDVRSQLEQWRSQLGSWKYFSQKDEEMTRQLDTLSTDLTRLEKHIE